MEVRYRQAFLRDLKKLKGAPAYDQIFEFAFKTLPEVKTLRELNNVKAMKGYQVDIGFELGTTGLE